MSDGNGADSKGPGRKKERELERVRERVRERVGLVMKDAFAHWQEISVPSRRKTLGFHERKKEEKEKNKVRTHQREGE